MRGMLSKKSFKLLVFAIILVAIASTLAFRRYQEVHGPSYMYEEWLSSMIDFHYELHFAEDREDFRQGLRHIDDGFGNIIYYPFEEGHSFQRFVPFDWNRAYIFKPGTTKGEIEDIIGFKDMDGFLTGKRNPQRYGGGWQLVVSDNLIFRGIPSRVRENYTQILFINDKFHGYSVIAFSLHARKPYIFDFGSFDYDDYIRINSDWSATDDGGEDTPRVRVMRERENGKIVVRLIFQE